MTYLTMLGWSNFSSCFSREISRRMAMGTPSSVSVNRIFFSATIASVDLSRARYTVPYAPAQKDGLVTYYLVVTSPLALGRFSNVWELETTGNRFITNSW